MNSQMPEGWATVDPKELRLAFDKHVGGPGQFENRSENPTKFFLPLAGESCKAILTFTENRIVLVEPGQACSAAEWGTIVSNVNKTLFDGPWQIGRELAFSSYRVTGSWVGSKSNVQILPAPSDAPRPPTEQGEHPFLFEFPIQKSDEWGVTNHRRMKVNRQLSLLLNILLNGRTTCEQRRHAHFWAQVSLDEGKYETRWVEGFYFAKIGPALVEQHSPAAEEGLKAENAEVYYDTRGHDGEPLRLPSDLDEMIVRYFSLSDMERQKFDRAAFWMDLASKQWESSVSASFASLVSAIEALTDRGQSHSYPCPVCKDQTTHEAPGATKRFRDFFETYVPGSNTKARRNEMYKARSGILHGSSLFQIDLDAAFGWDPPSWNQYGLSMELWRLAKFAIRNWLKEPDALGKATASGRIESREADH